jgi:hypothetical protein
LIEAIVITILKSEKDPNEPTNKLYVQKHGKDNQQETITRDRGKETTTRNTIRFYKKQITLESLIGEAIRKKDILLLLSLDIFRAYDTCLRYTLL